VCVKKVCDEKTRCGYPAMNISIRRIHDSCVICSKC
jgi:hypothetical protein